MVTPIGDTTGKCFGESCLSRQGYNRVSPPKNTWRCPSPSHTSDRRFPRKRQEDSTGEVTLLALIPPFLRPFLQDGMLLFDLIPVVSPVKRHHRLMAVALPGQRKKYFPVILKTDKILHRAAVVAAKAFQHQTPARLEHGNKSNLFDFLEHFHLPSNSRYHRKGVPTTSPLIRSASI